MLLNNRAARISASAAPRYHNAAPPRDAALDYCLLRIAGCVSLLPPPGRGLLCGFLALPNVNTLNTPFPRAAPLAACHRHLAPRLPPTARSPLIFCRIVPPACSPGLLPLLCRSRSLLPFSSATSVVLPACMPGSSARPPYFVPPLTRCRCNTCGWISLGLRFLRSVAVAAHAAGPHCAINITRSIACYTFAHCYAPLFNVARTRRATRGTTTPGLNAKGLRSRIAGIYLRARMPATMRAHLPRRFGWDIRRYGAPSLLALTCTIRLASSASRYSACLRVPFSAACNAHL